MLKIRVIMFTKIQKQKSALTYYDKWYEFDL